MMAWQSTTFETQARVQRNFNPANSRAVSQIPASIAVKFRQTDSDPERAWASRACRRQSRRYNAIFARDRREDFASMPSTSREIRRVLVRGQGSEGQRSEIQGAGLTQALRVNSPRR